MALAVATMCHMGTGTLPDMRTVGRRVAERRDELGLDQEALADKAGLSRPYISRLERGLVPSPKLLDLAAVAKALDYSLDQLIYGRPSGDLLAELPALLSRVTAPEVGALMAELATRYPTMDADDRMYFVQTLRRL